MFSTALNWYQKKIGAYDKQSWEKNIDQRILQGMSVVPKKLARVKTEFIDIDLVRGSAFPKAKPQHSWIAATLSGVIRVLFLPFYFTWWRLQTNALVSCCLVLLYILQIFAVYLFYSESETDFSDVPTSEAITPIVMMLILGILHSQIVATFSIKNSHKRVSRAKRKRAKRNSRVQTCNNKSSAETASEGQSNIRKCYIPSPTDGSQTYPCSNQNGSCQPIPDRNVIKKCSDDESGLDIMDSTIKDKFKCEVNGDSDAATIPYHRPLNVSSSHKPKTDQRSVQENDTHDGNISSGEEYFVAKRIIPTKEEWRDYVFNLERKIDIKRNFVKTSFQHPNRRYSDLSPVPDCLHRNEQLETRFSEGCLSARLQKSHRSQETKRVQKKKIHPWNFASNSMKYRHHVNPLTLKKGYSSGDSAPDTTSPNTPLKQVQTSDLEWPLITNTDCNTDSSDSSSDSSRDPDSPYENPFAWEVQETRAVSYHIGCSSSDKVSCTIWERNECQKVDLSVLDISSAIIRKVDSSVPSTEYLTMGLVFATVITLLPLLFRLQSGSSIDTIQDVTLDVINFTVPSTDYVLQIWDDLVTVSIGAEWRVKTVVLIAMVERFSLSLVYFFLLSVAEKTFQQRFQYAKHFSCLTSSRKGRRAALPHFRLNKVRNIKTWLSVRSYLKKLGPQRSVDVIVSVAFILEVCVLSFLCVQLLKETGQFSSKLHSWETIFWTLALGFYLLRFMIIGSKINKKYRNRSVLITEQINLYLHMEQKPHKKEELMLANSVLKLAADLLKELESPFKISGLCANPYLYNITKVVVLSAFSAVLTEILGFKLKLYKIKLQ